MKFESQPISSQREHNEKMDIPPQALQLLPIEDKGDTFSPAKIPSQHDVIEKVGCMDYFGGKSMFYLLTTKVGDIDYFFKLKAEMRRKTPEEWVAIGYSFDFSTVVHEYARTNLNGETGEVLGRKIASFLETAYEDSKRNMSSIYVSPSGASYSVTDIENCVSEILASTKEFSEETLREEYRGYQIFRLYKKLFGKDFGGTDFDSGDSAFARSRYFKMKCAKVLPNWEIKETYKGSVDFSLERKERENISLSS